MDGLSENIASVKEYLDNSEAEREQIIAESRKIIRLSKKAIHSIHLGEDPTDDLETMKKMMVSLISSVKQCGDTGPLADAMMEYAEASLLYDVVTGNVLRSPEELAITKTSWLMGLADTIGEIRRVIVTMLMSSKIDEAMSLFTKMEAICEELLMFDVPDAVLPIRRKQDVARSLVERTRSDLMNAKIFKTTI